MKWKKIFSVLMSVAVTASSLLQGITVTTINAESQNTNESTVMNDFSVEGTNSFGNLIASGIESEMNDAEENNGCKVYSVEMNENVAEVSFASTVDCSLVVAVYDDAGEKMIASGMADISSNDTKAEVTIDIDAMPEYFYLRAYLVDRNSLSPICSVYENPNYTQSMKVFFDKTIDDFEPERVLNFDDDITNNFAVYDENTKIIQCTDVVNVLTERDDINGVYTFENIDENISSLQVDDIFTYAGGDEQDIIVKVKTISIDGTTATLTSSELTLEDVFEYIKIDEQMNQDDAEFDTEGIPDVIYSNFDQNFDDFDEPLVQSASKPIIQSKPDVEFDEEAKLTLGADNVEGSISHSVKVKFIDKSDSNKDNQKTNNDNDFFKDAETNVGIETSFSGELTYKSDLSLKIYLDMKKNDGENLNKDDIKHNLDKVSYFEIKWKQSVDVDIKLKAEFKGSIPLCHIRLPFYGFVVKWEPKFIVEASGEVNINGNFTETLGFKVGKQGTQNISEPPKFSSDIKIEGTFAIGIDLSPTLYFLLEHVSKVDTELSAKFKITASASLLEWSTNEEEQEDKHDCMELGDSDKIGCIDGKLDLVLTAKATGKLFNSSKMQIEVGADTTIHLNNFYYSIKYGKLDWGECPHKHYYYNLTVSDKDGVPVPEAEIIVNNKKSGSETSFTTDENGKITVYLTAEDNSITCKKNKFETKIQKAKVDVDFVDDIDLSMSYGDNNSLFKTNSSNVSSVTTNTTSNNQSSTVTTTAQASSDSSATTTTMKAELKFELELLKKKEVVKINDKTSRDGTVELDPVMYPVKVNVIDKNGKAVNASFETSYAFDDNSSASPILGQSAYILKLPEGTWDITAIPKDSYYDQQTQSVTIQEGNENIEITFTFEDNRAGATVILTDQYGNPVPDASINIQKIDAPELVVKLPTTDENGIYTKNLSKGDYEITVKKKGYDAVTDTFTVGDEPLNIEITMQCNDDNNNQDTSGNIIDSGTCGENVFWELRDTGLLRIYGTGDIESYYGGEPPWNNRRSLIKRVKIEDGVTNIAVRSFLFHDNLTNIIIPDSVTSIGMMAFYECTSLTEITIPDSVISIGKSAFCGCTGLTSITIPDSVISIGKSAFRGTSFTSITIPDSVTDIGGGVFYGCSLLENITLSSNITSLNSELSCGFFESCTGLINITIPDSIIIIGSHAFEGCTGLTEITIPDSVTTIDNEAFKGCTNLTDIIIPDSVTSIGDGAFQYTGLTEIIIPNSVTSIGRGAFDNCKLTKVIMPGDVMNMKSGVFLNNSIDTLIIANGSESITREVVFSLREQIKNVVIPESVSLIGNMAFEECTNLTNVILPNSVTFIAAAAFYNCRNLTSVTIPSSITVIGQKAFNGTILKDVYYAGTEEEWNNIDIGYGNDNLKNATIHYNSTGATPMLSPAPPAIKLNAVSVLAEETAEEITAKTADFTDLKPNTVYNFYSMKSREAENPLSSENLLYISQAVSDENGNLSVSYIPREETEEQEEFVTSQIYDIGYADITTKDFGYTGKEVTPEVTVRYNGTLLEESKDYEILIPEKTVDSGAHLIIIRGIGDYFNDTVVGFLIICEHEYSDHVCTICGQTDPNYSTTNRLSGDADNDGLIDLKDIIIISKYLAGGWNVSLNESNSDVNGDGNINIADLVLISRYLAGGWDIELR